MDKIRVAIVGYGNIGRYALQSLQTAPDMEVAGVVRRNGAENCPKELEGIAVVKDIKELGKVDVALLATPTRSIEKYALEMLSLGIHTVDSFDIHSGIVDLRRTLDAAEPADYRKARERLQEVVVQRPEEVCDVKRKKGIALHLSLLGRVVCRRHSFSGLPKLRSAQSPGGEGNRHRSLRRVSGVHP